jgi:hypothetical protein
MHRQEDRKTKRYIDRKIDRHTGKKDLHSNEIDTEKGRQKQHERSLNAVARSTTTKKLRDF